LTGDVALCVPNVSEGRDVARIARLTAAVASAAPVKLLDVHSDPDHNRSVLTIAGALHELADAAFALAAESVAAIDLNAHSGVHPRMGAIDVIPFVPLQPGAMDPCVDAAVGLARRIGAELGVPVYLYGAAATPGGPAAVAEVRGKGFEALRAGVMRPPDFGPSHLHPTAGAVAVGARPALIAFNAMLASTDLAKARAVARGVRGSSGGLPAVQALGLPLAHRGVVQVSMNLLDYRVTGIAEVMAELRRLAAGAEVEVAGCELVGLLPAAALAGIEDDPTPGMPRVESTIEWRLANVA
jgi:glutamate formiminotransferase